MIRILQLQRSIRCLSSVRSNLAKTITTQKTVTFYASSLAATKEAESESAAESVKSRVQNALTDIQRNLRMCGNISNKQIVDLTNSLSVSEISSAEALAAIRCFTNLSIDLHPSHRIIQARALWEKLKKSGVRLEVTHYNALLRVYLDNDHNFNPTEFLADMAEDGVGPNSITYQFLVERYCQLGEVTEASRIIRFMEEKQVPINLNTLNLMIMGHARNNDMEGARDVINVMQSKGFTPDESTYSILLAEYARKGDADSIIKFLEDKENRNLFLDSRSIANILYHLCVTNHHDAVGQVVQRAPVVLHTEIHAIVHRLATAGHVDGCIALLQNVATNLHDDLYTRLATFVLFKIELDKKQNAEEVFKLVKSIPRGNASVYHSAVLKGLLDRRSHLVLSYIELLEKESYPLTPTHFFPVVALFARAKDIKALSQVMLKLRGKMTNSDVFTLYQILRVAGWNRRSSVHALIAVRPFQAVVKACFRTAILQRQPAIAREIVATGPRYVVHAANVVAFRMIINSFQPDDFAKTVYSLVACCQANAGKAAMDAAAEEASDAEAESGEAEGSAAAGAAAADAAEDVAEDAAEEAAEDAAPEVKENKFEMMSKQDMADYFVRNVVAKARDSNVASEILKAFLERGLYISRSTEEELCQSTSNEDVRQLLKQLSSRPLRVITYRPLWVETYTELLEEYVKADELRDRRRFILTELIVDYSSKNNPKTVELYKRLGENTGRIAQRAYVEYVCRNDATEGLECYRKYGEMNNFNLAFIHLARVLIDAGRNDEALDIILKKKDFIEKSRGSLKVQRLFAILSSCPDEKVQDALKAITIDEDMAKSLYINQLSNLGKSDPEAAVHFYEQNFEQYGHFGFRNLAIILVEREEYESLQKLQNVLSDKTSETESLFHLALVLLHCGKVPQAKRIIEMSNQFSPVIHRLLKSNNCKSLENLLQIIPPYHPRKDDICEKLLQIYDKKSDAESALALWARMEESNVSLPRQCLQLLSDLLQRCGYEVPFENPAQDSKAETLQKQRGDAFADTSQDVPTLDKEKAWKLYRENNLPDLQYFIAKLNPKHRLALRRSLARQSILDENPNLLRVVLPQERDDNFNILFSMCGQDPLREKYAKMVQSVGLDDRNMLRAWWVHSFLRGEERACKHLWKKFGVPSMLQPPPGHFSLLDGHEERYWTMMKEIDAPVRVVVHAFMRLFKHKVSKDPKAAFELVEANADLMKRISLLSAKGLRHDLAKAGASAQHLEVFDTILEECKGSASQEPS